MSNSRTVKFVATDHAGLPIKRKQVSNACSDCRSKKRRCNHHPSSNSTRDALPAGDEDQRHRYSPVADASPNSLPPVLTPQTAQPSPSSAPAGSNEIPQHHYMTGPAHYSLSPVLPPPVRRREPPSINPPRPQSSRFVGDLNPEGILTEAAEATSGRTAHTGIWLPSQFLTSQPPPLVDHFLAPFVKEHCLSCLPPDDDYLALKAVFLQKIHPLFPIIPESALDAPPDSPTNIVLRQLVSLAASTDPSVSRRHLKLLNRKHGQELLKPSEFSHELSSAVRAILETSMVKDRMLHIRALSMLSLYTQPTSPEEADLPAQLGGRAIHHVHTLGLHLLRYDTPNSAEFNTVFCAVWALDRINAAMYGRPCIIHERDVGATLESCIKKQPACFRLMLGVITWLDQVIELYRPGPSAEISGLQKVAWIDLPVLEGMIVEADALKVPPSLIATIETFYHAVIVLSCRLPRPGTLPAASTLPPASANARRSLAAERIACAVPRDHLSPFPLVPYAVSLALSVEYRKMRHSRLPMFRARAMDSFRRNCDLVREFGDYFWSAKVVAGLGDRVLKEMERAATTLTREASPQPHESMARSNTSAGDQSQMNQALVSSAIGSTVINSTSDMNNMVDFSLIDAVSGQDVFGHIDPNFDLNAVEDALEANLDIGLPLNWNNWGQFASPGPAG